MKKRKISKAEARAELTAALLAYDGPITHCPPGSASAPGMSAEQLNEQGALPRIQMRADGQSDRSVLRETAQN